MVDFVDIDFLPVYKQRNKYSQEEMKQRTESGEAQDSDKQKGQHHGGNDFNFCFVTLRAPASKLGSR